MNVSEVHAYRRFCNKLWQACRFAVMCLGDGYVAEPVTVVPSGHLSLFDKWILSQLDETIGLVNEAFESYVLMNATKALYSFWLSDLCDVYIEAIKPVLNAGNGGDDEGRKRAARATLFKCVHDGLLLLHPMMPFVTEELYQRLPRLPTDTTESACIAALPTPTKMAFSDEERAAFAKVFGVVKEIRSIAASSEPALPRGCSIVLRAPAVGSVISGECRASMEALVKAVGTLSVSDGGAGSVPPRECLLESILQTDPSLSVHFYNNKC
jgi:valyl-tRNA synthetase